MFYSARVRRCYRHCRGVFRKNIYQRVPVDFFGLFAACMKNFFQSNYMIPGAAPSIQSTLQANILLNVSASPAAVVTSRWLLWRMTRYDNLIRGEHHGSICGISPGFWGECWGFHCFGERTLQGHDRLMSLWHNQRNETTGAVSRIYLPVLLSCAHEQRWSAPGVMIAPSLAIPGTTAVC